MEFDDVDTGQESEVTEMEETGQELGDISEQLEEITQELEEVPQELEEWTEPEAALEVPENILEALETAPDQRSCYQTELVDSYRHPDYDPQFSFMTDRETGQALLDEQGDLIPCSRNTKGSQRPDGYMEDDMGRHLREAKCYHDLDNLKNNIRQQTEARFTALGPETDLTYVVAPNFTLEQAEQLQQFCEEDLGVNLEWQLK